MFEEFKCKNRYIHFYQFEIFAIKAAENKKSYFFHNFKNIPCYVMSEVSLKRIFVVALFDDGLTLKTLKLAFIGFCIQTLYLFCCSCLSAWVHACWLCFSVVAWELQPWYILKYQISQNEDFVPSTSRLHCKFIL